MTKPTIDKETRDWIRNASDELAARNGCRFDGQRGQHAIDWMQANLRLYQGRNAGEPFISEDWQYDFHMRLYSWIRWDDFVGREIRRFREASVWIAKKNKKSPTLAANAIYVLCADTREHGQNCFLCAIDGKQARDIAGKHAIEMVRKMPYIRGDFKINENEASITHLPTLSVLKPLSSANRQTEASKEGINGSLFVDETHIVNASFMGRLSRAGRSRDEPLHLEFSTAGDDPDCYGAYRWRTGREIQDGKRTKQSFLHIEYAPPDNTPDSELARDPLKYAAMANPALGHTINPQEIVDDVRDSFHRPAEWKRCKQYTFNLWQRVAMPWLSDAKWRACGRDETLNDMEGRPCYGGLDLSITNDLTSLVLTFDVDGVLHQFPFLWLPESAVDNAGDEAPFEEWAAAGWLDIIPGDVIEQQAVVDKIAALHRLYRLLLINMDKTYAEGIRQTLVRDYGIEGVDFPQTAASFAGPIDQFEAAILTGDLCHPNNDAFTWQAEHATFTQDGRGRKMLAKPKSKKGVKKIDSMVAAVMSAAAAWADPYGGKSVYSEPGSMTL